MAAVACRPLDLGDACCVCWQNEDQGRILICDGCDQEYHAYCVDPPLAELPEEGESSGVGPPKPEPETLFVAPFVGFQMSSIRALCFPRLLHMVKGGRGFSSSRQCQAGRLSQQPPH